MIRGLLAGLALILLLPSIGGAHDWGHSRYDRYRPSHYYHHRYTDTYYYPGYHWRPYVYYPYYGYRYRPYWYWRGH